jgi:hypothetical protein
MIPGYGSSRLREEEIASAATIVVKADLVRITGTTQIDNIFSPVNMGRDGVLIFVYTSGAGVTISAAGNVAVSQALVTNRLYVYAFSNLAAKWIPHGVA